MIGALPHLERDAREAFLQALAEEAEIDSLARPAADPAQVAAIRGEMERLAANPF